jgi:hypothetical protein
LDAYRLSATHFTPTRSARHAPNAIPKAPGGFVAAYTPATQLSKTAASKQITPKIEYAFMKIPFVQMTIG